MPGPAAHAQALAIAAPSAVVDELAPWTTPNSAGDVAMAGTVWFGFHSLSAFLHVLAIVLALIGTLLPIPLLASMCSTVQLVEKPVNRVEVALVAAPPPPPPPRIVEDGLKVKALVADGVAVRTCSEASQCKMGERCVDGTCVADVDKKKPPTRKKNKKHQHDDELMAVGILRVLDSDSQPLAMLSALNNDAPMVDLVGTVEGNGDNALGGLIGSASGDAGFGVGGLGLRGDGPGGGGNGSSIGIGTFGTIGHGAGAGVGTGKAHPRAVTLTLDGVDDAKRRAAERRLAHCDIDVEVQGTVTVTAGAITALDVPRGRACIKASLSAAARTMVDGTTPLLITPHDPR